jgi:hypothetical protein
MDLLEIAVNTPINYPYKEGAFVYVFEPAYEEEYERLGFSPAFMKVIRQARSLECKYVQFDRDGAEYPELEKFDW